MWSQSTIRRADLSDPPRRHPPGPGASPVGCAPWPATVAGEVAELLQAMIRNACVNDGTPESGPRAAQRRRSCATVLEGRGPRPGDSTSRCPGAPRWWPASRAATATRRLALLGHTDVVPANADDWRHDPFGGEIIDGEVWGRGAVDMLNLTASMAVAVRHLADEGFRPEGDLLFIGVADEEALGSHGAEWLTEHVGRRGALRLPHHRGGRVPHGGARRRAPAGHHRREGRLLVHHDRARHPGPRLAAAAHRQRAGEGGRGGAPAGRARDARRHPRRVAPLRRGHRPPRGVHRPAARPRPHRRLLRDAARPRPRPPGPRLHPHHHRPHGHARPGPR